MVREEHVVRYSSASYQEQYSHIISTPKRKEIQKIKTTIGKSGKGKYKKLRQESKNKKLQNKNKNTFTQTFTHTRGDRHTGEAHKNV